MTAISKTSSRAARLLLIGCSSLALSMPAVANEMIFSSSGAQLQVGQRTSQSSGVTQIALTGGGMVSIVDSAEYTINADGSIDLYKGSITVSGGNADDVVVRMPEGLEGRVSGAESSASFSVADDGEASGHTLGGDVSVGRNGRGMRKFSEGMMWSAAPGRAPRRAIANDSVVQPDRASSAPSEPQPPQVAAIGGDAGPVAAAVNGIPVTLGDGLAAAGASSDIIDAGRRVEAAVANPSIETFPSGDFALLIAAAAQLEGAYGGRPFNAAQADVIRAYLRFLASGGAQADFLTAYSGFVLNYLDLIRAGGVPSGFASGVATAADVDAYLAFIGRTGAIANLAARDRALADAYLAFIASGGNRDLFAASFTDLTAAYFAFLRAGGVPGDFTGASQDALAQSIAFLRQSGLDQQLNDADRALITAFLENGGIAFAAQFQTALDAYFAYLASGQLPSDYDELDQATLRSYLETLANTGLLEAVLADQASFYADYLAFLRAGGDVDAFAGLPANIFAGYAVQLDAYFAFLAAGNLPSQFNAADIAQLQAFILELQAAGALDRFVGANQAAFFASFGQFVANGGAFDNFAGLNANIFAGYAVDLQAYFDFLANGGIPSAYTILSQETIEAYIAALEAAGATDRFLVDLADFYQAYFQFVLGGGNPDNFAGLPVPPDFPAFAAALNAYAAFLAANGLPSDYSDEDIARLEAFFTSVLQSGQANALLGDNADLLTAYFAFLAGGGQIDGFAGLPIYLDYVAALNAYAAFLAGGGLPSDYAALDLLVLRAYLDALAALPGGLAGFDALADNAALVSAYFAFVSAGGDIDGFTGLPIYADYVAALNAYFEFLANGGLPSDYTELDLAILEAYLAALAALQGGLAGFGDLNDFFVEYYAFLLNGGDPDQFAGLPGNGGGNGGNPDIPPQLAGYAGGFDAVEPLIGFVLGGGFNGGLLSGGEGLGFKAGNLVLDENGGLQSYVRLPSTGGARTKGSTEVVDIFGNSDALIGRWTNGTISIPNTFTFNENQGLHYLLTRPVQPDFALPVNGRIDYYQIAATRPTIADGSVAPGVFDAQMAILLGTEAKLALEGTITMPTGVDPYVFSFSTAGGIADPSQSTNVIGLTTLGTFSAFVAATDNGGTCGSIDSCGLSLTAGFAGDINTVGLTYRAVREGFGQNLAGAAIFEAGPERTFGGGDTGGTPTGDYTGGFSAAAANSVTAYAYSLTQAGFTIPVQARTPRFGGTNFGVTPNQHIIDENGGLVRIQGSNGATVIDRETALNVDIAGDADLLIGRWTDGRIVDGFGGPNGRYTLTANQGFHYFLARGLENPVSVAPGLVTYTLAHATQPTLGSGRSAPGVFNANLAIEYGAAPKLGIDGTIVFEGTSGFTYTFATNGGAAAPSKEISFTDPSASGRGGFFSFTSDTGSTDTGLDGLFGATGSLGKADGSDVAIGYTVDLVPRTGFQGESIAGAAIFRSQDGSGTGSGSGNGSGGNTGAAVPNQLIAYAGADVGIDLREKAEVTYNAAGAPIGYVSRINDFTAENERPTIGTATAMEAGSRGNGLIGWTRWADGQGGGRYFADTDGFTLPANGGFHIVAVDPASDLPTGGQITYELAGATNPTVKDASLAPGTFNGTMAIAFGAAPTADFNFTVGIGGSSYNFGASGRPIETSGDFANQFGANGMAVSGTGSVCPAGACQANMRGILGGVGATAVGVSYNFAESGNENLRTYGAAAFVAPGVGTSSASGALTTASLAPSITPIAGGDWSRWMGAPGANPQTIGSIGADITFDPMAELRQTVAGAEGRPATAAQRDWAIDQVERLMGGMITFGGEVRVER